MIDLEEFQVRGVSGRVNKVSIDEYLVDYWSPENPGSHVIVTFDGQNVLDKRNIGINPHQRATWELASSAIRMAGKNRITSPTIICIYHTSYAKNKLGRLLEYTPEKYMRSKLNWKIENYGLFNEPVESFLDQLSGDQLVKDIVETIVPSITNRLNQNIYPENMAILGASMGGLASIYAGIQQPDFFQTILSFSPHWVIGGDDLASKMMSDFPIAGKHKLWMSRGTKGLDALYQSSQDLADKIIRLRGYQDRKDLISRVLNKGAHSNATWARYVPAALDFWLREQR